MNEISSPQENHLVVVRQYLKEGRITEALQVLRTTARPDDDFSKQTQYARIAKLLLDQSQDLPEVRIAFLSHATLDHFIGSLRFWLLLEGFRLQAYVAPFGAWQQECLDASSGLYQSQPDVVWWFFNQRDASPHALPSSTAEECLLSARQQVNDWARYVATVLKNRPVLPVVNNVESTAVQPFGNYEASVPWSRSALLASMNACLPQLMPAGTVIFDLAHQAACFGINRWEDARYWHHSKHPFCLEATGHVAFAAAKVLGAARGRAHKCLVVDLDNTLWGGVVGDEGAKNILCGPEGGAIGEAFFSFQRYIKSLAARGIILAVCSKNELRIVREAFDIRPDMPLHFDDFAIFCVNWGEKSTNLIKISQELNIGLDALVFFDDNPVERAQVRAALPSVAVVDVPRDPADFITALAAGRWFETVSFAPEDGLRADSYRANSARVEAEQSAPDLPTFLTNLKMQACWGKAEEHQLPRLSQLTNKTNQFHLTTTRYSLAEIKALAESSATWVGWFSLQDAFSDHGIIALAILRFADDVAVIDTWTLSCRVFSRGMEDFIFRILWQTARERGARVLEGHYRATDKNTVVAHLYDRLGGQRVDALADTQRWHFDLSQAPSLEPGYIADKSQPTGKMP